MQTDSRTFISNPHTIAPLRWSEACGWTRQRHAYLEQEHRDLDDIIHVLSQGAVPDDALIARLKKRKLHVKDEIVRLEAAVAA